MKWFRHDSSANRDAKLQKLRMKYGLEGYGLYWYCIELIAEGIEESNLTFELEHDAEIIAFNTGNHPERVEEMMRHMVKLKLFEEQDGIITCFKLARRLDQSSTSNAHMRKLIAEMKKNPGVIMMQSGRNHDEVMTPSDEGHDEFKTESDQIRLDKNRLDKSKNNNKRKHRLPDDFEMPLEWSNAAKKYWGSKNRSDLNALEEFEKFKAHHLGAGTTSTDFKHNWRTWYANAIQFNKPSKTSGQYSLDGQSYQTGDL